MKEYREITSSFFTVSSYGITTLTLNPSSINAPSPIMSIDYAWSNGNVTSVKRKLDVSNIDSSNFPFPGDPGDPRNIEVVQVFFPGPNLITHYTVQVLVKYADQATKQLVSVIDMILQQSPLFDDGLNDGYAKGVHLVANRIWDFGDKKMFVLETVSPNNVFVITPN